MTLDAVSRGQKVTITAISDEKVRMQALRFGIGEGTEVYCEEVIPMGAIVLRRKRQQIAVGRHLAESITVVATPDA